MEVAIRRLGPHWVRGVVPTAQRGILSSLKPFYATPNPSAHRPLCPAPNGYWHVCYNRSGRMTWQQDDADHIYINDCSGSPGNFRMKGADKVTSAGTDNGKGISA